MTSVAESGTLQAGTRISLWRYAEESRRDLRLDLIRGVCIAIVLIDHIGGWSPIHYLTGGGNFFVTAAEGFVCISGALFGSVYRPIAENQGFGAVWRKALKRSATLYAITVLSSFMLLLGGRLGGLPWDRLADGHHPLWLVWEVLTFQRIHRLTQILAMYVVLIAVAPCGIWLLYKRRPASLLAVSWALYLAYELFPRQLHGPFPADLYFHPLAYQVLFVHAMIAGYNADPLRDWFAKHRRVSALGWTAFGFLLLLLLYAVRGRALPLHDGRLGESWATAAFDRDLLRPGRVIASAIVLPFFYLLADRLWTVLKRTIGWLFIPFGRFSLYCYVVHIPIAAASNRLAMSWAHFGPTAALANMCLQCAVLAVVWLLVRYRVLTKYIP